MEQTQIQNEEQQQQQEQNQQMDTSNIKVETRGNSTIATVTDDENVAVENNSEETTVEEKSENVQEQVNNQLKAEEDLKQDLKGKGLDFDSFAKEFEENGELSKESLEALSKAGYPKSIVDAYIHGMQATTEHFVNEVIKMAGTKDDYAKLVSYLQVQPQDTIKAFNSLIERGDLKQIKLAIRGIQAEMKDAYGTHNSTIMSRNFAGGGVASGYKSQQEMIKAMSDPRYGKDKAYTNEVYQKVAKANF